MAGASPHPLLGVLERAAAGVFPPVDGGVEALPSDGDGTWAIAEFTGHSFVLSERSPGDPLFDGVDGFGGVTEPGFVLALAGRDAFVGSHDLVLVRPGGSSAAPLAATTDFDDHQRVVRARRHRRDVRVHGDERGVVAIGTGLAGRTELSVEVFGDHGTGSGRALILAGLAGVPADELVFAQVAPGNAASVRAFLACGFTPIGSEILIEPSG